MSIKKQRIRVIYRHTGLLITIMLQCYGFRTGMWPAVVAGLLLALCSPGFTKETFNSRLQSCMKHKNAYIASTFMKNAALLFGISMNMQLSIPDETVEQVGATVKYMPLPFQLHYVITHGLMSSDGVHRAVMLLMMSTVLFIIFAGTDMYWYLLGLKEFPSEGDKNA